MGQMDVRVAMQTNKNNPISYATQTVMKTALYNLIKTTSWILVSQFSAPLSDLFLALCF